MAAVVSTPSKTQGTTLLSLQAVSASAEVVGSEVDVTGKFAGMVFIHFGRTTNAAPSAGVTFRIEAADKSSGAGHWYPVAQVTTNINACNTSTNTSTSGANQTLASGTGFAVQDLCLVNDGTQANAEWARIKSISSNVLTMEENLINSHSTGSTYNKAEMYAIPIDLSGIGRLRVVADGSAHAQAFVCEAYLNTLDSVSSV